MNYEINTYFTYLMFLLDLLCTIVLPHLRATEKTFKLIELVTEKLTLVANTLGSLYYKGSSF